MTAKRARQRHNRVVGAFVKIPAPLEPGKVRCLGCGAVVALTRNHKIRAHNSPAGEPCAYRASYGQVKLEEAPPVVLPVDRSQPRARPRKAARPPSRLDVGSHCVDCGTWLPGERSLCGMCAVARESSRRKAKS